MDIYNNKLKIIMMIIILFLLNSCKFKDEALGSEHGKGDAMKKLDGNEKLKDARTPIQILLDGFNFSDEYKEAVLYIQKALTDPNVGGLNDKTYTDAEFYDLLVNLGKDRLENCTRATLLAFRVRKDIVDAIEALKDQAKKDEFNANLAVIDGQYLGFLKFMGSTDIADQVYERMSSHADDYRFEGLRKTVHDVFQNGIQQRVP
ncbi:hypothetical protein A0V01_04840 (plasmid) [Borrelia hermsii]|uniref:Lipoprotein n=1 Tax=Borrelia hermsii TaxID=140 RepID=A0AAN1CFA5_BORHE|nr:hypothetical protein [Borrelia hermsii]AMR75941.1 hypothetical protein A0V01_04840 [Borrelia hermsii]UPA08539.1 hypothetical protein bhDAH_001250 [Borrelia hermsii DAH]